MRRSFLIAALSLIVATTGCAQERKEKPKEKPDLSGKRILMVIAHQNFRDEEYQEPRELFEELGASVTVASSSTKMAKGMLGLRVKPDSLIEAIHLDIYDALVFVGGIGAMEYWEDERAHQLIKEAAKGGKVIGAICAAPVTLANAGILEGKKATVYSGAAKDLKAKGAIYTGKSVEVVGNIVTANGPRAAKKFGMAVAELLVKAKK